MGEGRPANSEASAQEVSGNDLEEIESTDRLVAAALWKSTKGIAGPVEQAGSAVFFIQE